MSAIWLVRHGEAAAGFSEDVDPALSELGQTHASAAARALEEQVPAGAALLTSPKRRAIQTGEPFALRRGVALQVDPRFVELPSPGELEARKLWLQEVLQGTWGALPESVQQWRREIMAAIQALQTPSVIFTHFLVINAVAAKMSADDAVVQCLPANGSIHHLEVAGADWRWASRGEMLKSVVN